MPNNHGKKKYKKKVKNSFNPKIVVENIALKLLKDNLADKEKEINDIKTRIKFNDMRKDKTEPIPDEIYEIMGLFKDGAYKSVDGKKIMNKGLTLVYDNCVENKFGMNMEWWDKAEKWFDCQISRGLDTFEKMKCYWTRVGAIKKNDIWYGGTDFGLCVIAGAHFGLPPEEWNTPRDPLEMD
jgi:hypothetical protein